MTEVQGSGDCFAAAIRVAAEFAGEDRPNVVICQGRPVYQGADDVGTDDGRFWHAWVEWGYGDLMCFVVDRSNGKDISVPREFYYGIGKLNDDHVTRYSLEEASEAMTHHCHTGPWWVDDYPPVGL